MSAPPLTVVAIGGNSLTQSHQVGTITEQRQNSAITCDALAELVARGHRLVVTHGNGPQVGNVLRRVEIAASQVYRLPMDICVSDTQGGIGYMLQQILGGTLERRGLDSRVVTLITQVRVSADDPAFDNPVKPVGPFMTEQEAHQLGNMDGWHIKHIDSRGWRRVVPSPAPLEVVELAAIEALIKAGITTICAGGGGVPVYRKGDTLVGVEAVIDKDRATALLAARLGAHTLIISTGVPQICLDFDTPNQRPLGELTLSEARELHDAGQFPPGSMGPKVEAAINFLAAGGGEVLITDPEHLVEGIEGRGGTWIRPDKP